MNLVARYVKQIPSLTPALVSHNDRQFSISNRLESAQPVYVGVCAEAGRNMSPRASPILDFRCPLECGYRSDSRRHADIQPRRPGDRRRLNRRGPEHNLIRGDRLGVGHSDRKARYREQSAATRIREHEEQKTNESSPLTPPAPNTQYGPDIIHAESSNWQRGCSRCQCNRGVSNPRSPCRE